MKHKYLLIIVVLALFLAGCGEVKKQIAGEQMVGKYSGSVTYIFKGSLLNIGIEDEEDSEDCEVIISNSDAGMRIETPDGKLKLTGLKLLYNGTGFNIAEQRITNRSGEEMTVRGNSLFEDTDGGKSDGFYLDERKQLQFAFSGIFSTEYYGMPLDLPVEAFFDVFKND